MGTARPKTGLWLVGGLCVALLLPKQASAQPIIGDLLDWFFNAPRWNADVHIGYGHYGRFLLQAPTVDPFDFRQRELKGRHAWTLGAGIGGTPMPRTGFRLGYNYATADLSWRDDTGTGSELLDVDDVGDIRLHSVGLELIRYLMLETSRFSPYFTVGVSANWWDMDPENSIVLRAPTGDTHFRWGGLGTVGVHYRFNQSFRVRLEVAGASVGNPFNGRDSYITIVGRPIDEPSRVSKSDLRLALQYTWGKPDRATSADDKGSR